MTRVGETVLPGVAPVAMQQGRYAAKVVLARLNSRTSEPFRYRDKGNLATIGKAAAVADFGFLRISGFVAWLLWIVVHIMFLIGFRNRVIVVFEWAWAYFTSQRGARLITGDLRGPPHPPRDRGKGAGPDGASRVPGRTEETPLDRSPTQRV
jgi:NADH dehydrogenase